MSYQAEALSLSALAVQFNRDRRTLARQIEDLAPDSGDDEPNKKWKVYRVAAHIYGQESPTDVRLSLDAERARLAHAQAIRTEIEVSKLRGELIEVAAVFRVWGKVVTDLRSRLLAIPTRATPLLIGCRTMPKIRDELERQIHEALNELAAINPAQYLVDGDARPAPAAAKAKGKRVGRSKPRVKSRKRGRARKVANP